MPSELEEHAEAAAEKKGLTGEARKRYIGGIFEKVRQAHAKASPERKQEIAERMRAIMRESDERRKAKEEEEARRRENPLAGYWYNVNTPERKKLLKEQKDAEKKIKRQEQGNLIKERTEEKRAREAYSRLLAKYHNPRLKEERAAARQEYDQLQKDLREARYQRFGGKQSQRERDIKQRMKALDSKYGFTEEEEDQRAIAQAAAAERQKEEEAERRKAEEERQLQQRLRSEAHMARREQVFKERDQWQHLSEPELQRKERQLADAWDKVSREREQLKKAGKEGSTEFEKADARYDLARMRYQAIDAVLAEKQRPARKAEQERTYRKEYQAYLQRGKTGQKPREGYLVSFDDARKIRGEALKAYNQEQKAKEAAGTPKPTVPLHDTRANVLADYNKLWEKLSDRERRLANFYIQKARGEQPANRTLHDPSIPAKRAAMIEQQATALGERSKALLEKGE